MVSVSYKVDNGAEQTVSCLGVFYAAIAGELANGRHTITAYATDKYGVKGNSTTVAFNAKGVAPVFDKAAVKTGGTTVNFTDGMEINPDGDPVYQTAANSTCGLKEVSYELTWGKDGIESTPITVKGGEKKIAVNVPLSNAPWGIVKLAITAKDIYDRTTVHHALLNMRNLSRVYSATAGVYFTDSTVANDGGIVNNPERPVTGYFVGGTIRRVELVPATKAATAAFDGNTIILNPGTGGSDPVVVRVTTDKGAKYDSRKIYFIADGTPPALTIEDDSEDTKTPVEMKDTLTVKGTTDPSANLVYRVMSARVQYANGVVISSAASPVPPLGSATSVTVHKNGSFSLTFKKGDNSRRYVCN